MKRQRFLWCYACCTLSLTGCASQEYAIHPCTPVPQAEPAPVASPIVSSVAPPTASLSSLLSHPPFNVPASELLQHQKEQTVSLHRDEYHGETINDYIRSAMYELVGNLHYVNSQTPIGVASFVYLSSDNLSETSVLGQQIAESFIHELHRLSIPVIDFKTKDALQVTPEGDFIFSRDYLKLQSSVPLEYILSGTLVRHQGGYLVNARIIGLASKAVVASAQSFIPNRATDAIIQFNPDGSLVSIQGPEQQ